MRFLVALIVQELARPRRRPRAATPRQTRRCPFCGAWFNTTSAQDEHERTCDQRPADGLPTPLQVLELAFPDYPPPVLTHAVGTADARRRTCAACAVVLRRPMPDDLCTPCRRQSHAGALVSEHRRGVLGTWQP